MKPRSSSTAGSIVSAGGQPGVQGAPAPDVVEEVGAVRPGAGPRLVPHLSHEPVSWWERQCPSCGRSFKRNVAACPLDATPLKRVEVSLPFLWIG